MRKSSKIYVAGHQGLVGSAVLRNLKKNGYGKLIYRTRREVDLTDQAKVRDFFKKEKPEYVFLAAARVGGIMDNKLHKADFIYENLEIECNVIYNAWKCGVRKLLFLGSSCIYPKECPQPIREDYFLSGKLEETNDAYAIAKIAGIKMCQSFNEQYGTNFISLMPTNLYGPNDNFDLENSHVVPALIRKFHEAKKTDKNEVILWGTGKAYREFLHVDDLAEACVFLMKNYNRSEILNVGTGKDVTIEKLARSIKNIVGFKGKLVWDKSKPDGTLRKKLNIEKIKKIGWRPKISLNEGLARTYRWFLKNQQ